MKTLFVPLITMMMFFGCTHSTEPDQISFWLRSIIAQYENQPSGNSPQIWRYDYDGKTVYYIIAPCCDQFNRLYNSQGNYLCSPDGGFVGTGDGKCPDFFETRTNGQLVWKNSKAS